MPVASGSGVVLAFAAEPTTRTLVPRAEAVAARLFTYKGSKPRNLCLVETPRRARLLVANLRSDSVTTFAVDPMSASSAWPQRG